MTVSMENKRTSASVSGKRGGTQEPWPGGLLAALESYGASNAYPFHMPGHKRNPQFMKLPSVNTIDITEIDGFDNLHHATGILKAAQERAARVRGAGRTWFLVNGSTSGLLSAISACTSRGGRVLAARNCHKSVYNAIELCGLHPVYIYPEIHPKYGIYKAVDKAVVEALLKEYEDIQAVVITSPTYEGVISDIRAISHIVHSYGLPLIVDSAHGAHLGYGAGFSPSPVTQGADLVIESLHKTLPSMTQTALIHRCGHRVDDKRLQKYLSIYQTSSPSYVMMAAIDQCMALLEGNAKTLFDSYSRRLRRLRQALENPGPSLSDSPQAGSPSVSNSQKAGARPKRPYIRLLGAADLCQAEGSSYDDSKLVLFVENCRGMGQWLYDRFREDYHLQMEMASADYVLAMTSICDTKEGFERLRRACMELNIRLLKMGSEEASGIKGSGSKTDRHKAAFAISGVLRRDESICAGLWQGEAVAEPPLPISEAVDRSGCMVALKEAIGRVSGAYLYIYPPGVPFCVPGERITESMIKLILRYIDAGLEVHGLIAGLNGKSASRKTESGAGNEISYYIQIFDDFG